VEANTVRLKEHGHDALVLEKIPANIKTADGSLQVQYKYTASRLHVAVALIGQLFRTFCDKNR